MYSDISNLTIGFHGCDISVHDSVLYDNQHLKWSDNPYDWLGHGIYFWEHNLQRAWEWANLLKKRNKINSPAVIGAIIDLGHCLDLVDSKYIELLEKEYYIFEKQMRLVGKELPKNTNVGSNTDLLNRQLDCAVINHLHMSLESENVSFDSVRGVFLEGDRIYENAGFKRLTHIQLCIRNYKCIKGYFEPLEAINSNC